jgi:hypothetical protein
MIPHCGIHRLRRTKTRMHEPQILDFEAGAPPGDFCLNFANLPVGPTTTLTALNVTS